MTSFGSSQRCIIIRMVLAIAVLFIPVLGYTDYSPKTLYQLLISSDIAVVGEIQKVNKTTYSLAVSRVLLGSVEGEILSVARIDNLPLKKRTLSYAREQEVVVFARTTAGESLQPIGSAGEGELITIEGSVYVPALSGSVGWSVRCAVPGTQMTSYVFSYDDFIVAVSGFFECFVATGDGGLRQTCTNPNLFAYRESSDLAAHLASIAGRVIEKGD